MTASRSQDLLAVATVCQFLSARTPQSCDKGGQDSFYLKNPTAGFEAPDCVGWSREQEDKSGRLSKAGGRRSQEAAESAKGSQGEEQQTV